MNYPIRVLHVLHGLNCGGAENMIMNLYRNIDTSKIQFDFLVHTNEKCFFDDEVKKLGGNIYHVPYYNVLNHCSYKKALNDFFKNHSEIKIVHGHLGSCAHIYLKIAKKYGCYAIVHSHSSKPDKTNAKKNLYKLFAIKTRGVADFFFGCSVKAGEYRYGKKIVNSERFMMLNNAIATEKYEFDEKERNRIRKEFGIEDKFVVGHVGRFNEVKNHDYLIDVFKCVSDKNENAVLMLVGGGELEPKIRKKAEMLGLEKKVIFTGVRSDVNLLLQAMDCFVFPSFYEGLPVVVIEAQAAGLQCIVSDTITREVQITEQVEYLPLDNIEKWCNAIVEKEKNTNRADNTQAIIKAGYDIKTTVKQLEELYISKV